MCKSHSTHVQSNLEHNDSDTPSTLTYTEHMHAHNIHTRISVVEKYSSACITNTYTVVIMNSILMLYKHPCIHGYQHITPSTLRVHPWLPTHHTKYPQSTSMATNTSHQVPSEYIHGYQHITPSTLRVHPWLPTHHSKYTQRTSMATLPTNPT